MAFTRSLFVLGLVASSLSTVVAQTNSPSTGVTLTQSVEPSFHIEPIIHRFSARRGEVVSFSFEIASTGKLMDVTVRPVALRQEESGIILHESDAEASDAVQILSAKEFKLAPGESHKIQGQVTVPITKSNFLSYGVLVRDIGQVSASPTPTGGQTTAAVRFVTQYVLRVDIETGVQDFRELSQVYLENGRLAAVDGSPMAQAFLVNPTNFAFECVVDGMLVGANSKKLTNFALSLPCRSQMPGDDRFIVRVLPKSRVRLEASINNPVYPGDQQLQLKVSSNRRSITENAFAICPSLDEFPATQARVAMLGDDISIEPSQIEIGRVAGARRTETLQFSNHSTEPRTIRLNARTLSNSAFSGLRFSNEEFELKPGRTKSIRISIDSASEAGDSLGHLVVTSASLSDNESRLPLAVRLQSSDTKPQLVAQDIQFSQDAAGARFLLPIQNIGETHIPIEATLTVSSSDGQSDALRSGYGRWLMPGEERDLAFISSKSFAPGRYQLKWEIRSTDGVVLETKTWVVNIGLDSSVVTPSVDDSQI